MAAFFARDVFSNNNRNKLIRLIQKEEKSIVRILSKKKDPLYIEDLWYSIWKSSPL